MGLEETATAQGEKTSTPQPFQWWCRNNRCRFSNRYQTMRIFTASKRINPILGWLNRCGWLAGSSWRRRTSSKISTGMKKADSPMASQMAHLARKASPEPPTIRNRPYSMVTVATTCTLPGVTVSSQSPILAKNLFSGSTSTKRRNRSNISGKSRPATTKNQTATAINNRPLKILKPAMKYRVGARFGAAA